MMKGIDKVAYNLAIDVSSVAFSLSMASLCGVNNLHNIDKLLSPDFKGGLAYAGRGEVVFGVVLSSIFIFLGMLRTSDKMLRKALLISQGVDVSPG